jgi:hypothetical protein
LTPPSIFFGKILNSCAHQKRVGRGVIAKPCGFFRPEMICTTLYLSRSTTATVSFSRLGHKQAVALQINCQMIDPATNLAKRDFPFEQKGCLSPNRIHEQGAVSASATANDFMNPPIRLLSIFLSYRQTVESSEKSALVQRPIRPVMNWLSR